MGRKTREEKEPQEEKSEIKEHKPVSKGMFDEVDFEDEGSDEKSENPHANERRALEQSLSLTLEQWENGRRKAKIEKLTSAKRDFTVKGRLLIYDSKDNIQENINGKVSIDGQEFWCRHWAPLQLKRNRDYRNYRTQPESYEDDMREILRLEREGELYKAVKQHRLLHIDNIGCVLAEICRDLSVGDEKHIRFCSDYHMMSIIIKHKVDNTTGEHGEYKGIALEFYDPNLTFKHLRVLAPDADALEEFELGDWLDKCFINRYFPLQQKVGEFFVDVIRSKTITEKVSETITEKVIVDDSLKIDDSLFFFAMGFLSGQDFRALVDGDDVVRLILFALRCQPAEAFVALVNKTRQDVFNTALTIKTPDGQTVLNAVMPNRSREAFMFLVNKASGKSLSEALILQSKDGWTPLHIAARYLSEEDFIALVNKVNVAELRVTLILQNKLGWTALNIVEHKKKSRVVLPLIEKIDIDTLNKVFLLVPKSYSTSEKRGYFLDTINLALDQIQASETLNIQNKKDLLNKLLQCVISRRDRERNPILGYNFNQQLDDLKRTIEERVDLIPDREEEKKEEEETDEFDRVEEKTDGVYKQSRNSLSSPIGLFEEKRGSEEEGSGLEREEVKNEEIPQMNPDGN